jgi:chloride channel protein, CIC family
MLPFDQPWYRRLIGAAAVLGIAGGVLSLLYLTATGELVDWVFGSPDGTLWSGEWWWIPLTAAGGLVVAYIRKRWNIQDHVPGGVEIIEAGEIDHASAPKWVLLAIISAVTGASLGPSFALVVMGGGLASWVAERRWAEGHADKNYTLTGIAGAFGAAFTSPILGAFMVSELAPISRARYVAAVIPQVIAASVGFMVFYSVLGRTFLGIYEVAPYEFEIVDMATAVGLGALGAAVMAMLVAIVFAVRRVSALMPNKYVLGVVGGAFVGTISMALPLTFGAGQSQLASVIENVSTLGTGLLVAILVAKMVALAMSLEVGFLGGNVFPMIFIGGLSGVIVNLLLPGIPIGLALPCMLAAVPGSYLRAPLSMTFIAIVAVALDPRTAAPVTVAVVTSYLVVATVRYALAVRHRAGESAATA